MPVLPKNAKARWLMVGSDTTRIVTEVRAALPRIGPAPVPSAAPDASNVPAFGTGAAGASSPSAPTSVPSPPPAAVPTSAADTVSVSPQASQLAWTALD
jgi:hypothetical protein